MSPVELFVTIALTAAVVGFLVGLTGVGAGALMTPILVVFFNVPPATAIATDLLYATMTKLVGGSVHAKNGFVNWTLLKPLWLGGVVGAGVGIGMLMFSIRADFADDFLRVPLAIVILLAAGSMLHKQFGRTTLEKMDSPGTAGSFNLLALGGGAGIGLGVALTSVGAGALGMALLMRLSPQGREPRELVGTDLMFAVPVALFAGLTYSLSGLTDFGLLLNLVAGSLPGVILGSLLARALNVRAVAVTISASLVVAAVLVVL